MVSNVSEYSINLNIFFGLWLYACIFLLMQDIPLGHICAGQSLLEYQYLCEIGRTFLICIRPMFVSFLLTSLASLQTITISSLLRFLISLSANDVTVSFQAPGIAVSVTSYYFPIKFANSAAQPWAGLSSVTIIFLLFCLTC